MHPTMSRRRLPVSALLALAALALAPAAASAGLHVDTYRGSHCNPSHFNGETEDWAYEGPNLVNRGGSAWDVLVASCPVHVAPPPSASANARILEIRVVVDRATYSNAWCNLHDVNGVERPLSSRSTSPEWFWWAPPSSWGQTQREFTIECLVLQDWALERIEVVWYW
jgi:hypothetical protein